VSVTSSDVLAIAPEFSSESPSRINALIAVATQFVNPHAWGPKTDIAIIYYTAHLLSVTPSASGATGASTARGPISQEKVGDISTSYSAGGSSVSSTSRTSFNASSYGQIFEEMKKTLVITPIPVNGLDMSGNPLPLLNLWGGYGR
jgi:hypothetical protein